MDIAQVCFIILVQCYIFVNNLNISMLIRSLKTAHLKEKRMQIISIWYKFEVNNMETN